MLHLIVPIDEDGNEISGVYLVQVAKAMKALGCKDAIMGSGSADVQYFHYTKEIRYAHERQKPAEDEDPLGVPRRAPSALIVRAKDRSAYNKARRLRPIGSPTSTSIFP